MKLLLTAATKQEINPVSDHLKSKVVNANGVDIEFLKTSIGMQNTRSQVLKIIETYQPCDVVINIGVAGSLSSTVKLLDVVFPTAFYTKKNAVINQIPVQNDIKALLSDLPESWIRGPLFTSDVPVQTDYQKAVITGICDAIAVDMEAYPIADICAKKRIPFFSLKVISDHADLSAKATFKRFLPQAMKVLQNSTADFIRCILRIKEVS